MGFAEITIHKIINVFLENFPVEPGQTHNNGHNSKNLSCVQPAKFRPTNMSQSLLSFCLMNTRSVRNKTAMLMDYICDLKADLYAMTETWLTENVPVLEWN